MPPAPRDMSRPLPPMSPTFYKAGRLMCNFIKFQCIREVVLHKDRAERHGPFILACTHISHLEPIVVASVVRRHIRWMARIEFYRKWWGAAMLHKGGAFPVDRFGFSLPAVRHAIRLLGEGQVVGIFPEGGVAQGSNSLLRHATIKQGVCTIAMRAGVPIVPVIVLGTQHLNRVSPWIPPRRAHLHIAFGRDVTPDSSQGISPATNRARRAELAQRLQAEFQHTLKELLDQSRLSMDAVP